MPPGVTVVPGNPAPVVGSGPTVTTGSGDWEPGWLTTIAMLASAGDIEAACTATVTVSCCPAVAVSVQVNEPAAEACRDLRIRSNCPWRHLDAAGRLA